MWILNLNEVSLCLINVTADRNIYVYSFPFQNEKKHFSKCFFIVSIESIPFSFFKGINSLRLVKLFSKITWSFSKVEPLFQKKWRCFQLSWIFQLQQKMVSDPQWMMNMMPTWSSTKNNIWTIFAHLVVLWACPRDPAFEFYQHFVDRLAFFRIQTCTIPAIYSKEVAQRVITCLVSFLCLCAFRKMEKSLFFQTDFDWKYQL